MSPLTPFLTLLLFILVSTCGRAQTPFANFRFEHDGKTIDLPALMASTQTQDVSMALTNGTLDSAFVATTQSASTLSVTTLFPAGAGSGLPVCIAVLQLVERGALRLDDPINPLLGPTPLSRGDGVTVRDLLLLKPQVGSRYKPDGFAAGAALPSLAEVARGFRFRGIRPAAKGTEYGSWVLLQLILEQHYGKPLNDIMQEQIFKPLCLENSFYATELSPAQAAAAALGHEEDGSNLPGGYQRYLVLADAGLWTTPQDYVRLTQSLLQSLAGATDGLLRPETVQMAMAERYGHRSLLFHISDSGLPYWGGNAKGYYFTMQAHPEENWVGVVMMNRHLNWRLGSPVVWQLGLLAKQWRSVERLGIVLQPEDTDLELISQLENAAFVQGIRTERLLAGDGLPADITATPAFVFQSPQGRAIYGGRHDDLAAIQRFVRLSQASPRKTATDERTDVLTLRRGRQSVILPLKFTPPTGMAAPAALPVAIEGPLRRALAAATGFTPQPTAALRAQDRRCYLDVHAYRTESGDYQLTFALFSQFDCHTPVATSFGAPVRTGPDGENVAALAKTIATALEEMLRPEKGLVPGSLPAEVVEKDWETLGWGLDEGVIGSQEVTRYAAPIAIRGAYRATLTAADAPGLFFSFPAPLDRYSGEVRALEVAYVFSEDGSTVAGEVTLPVATIVTSSGSLDTYVLGDILKSRKYPTASLVFGPTPVPGNWRTGEPLAMTIPAKLTIRGKEHAVRVDAVFTPGAAGTLAVAADFSLHFGQVFGMDGPDGPESIRNQLDFTARFTATAADRAR